MHVLSVEQSKINEQCTNIMDMTGFGMSKMNKKTWQLIQLMSGVAQDNYPEILGATYIVNAPMVFNGVWAIAKNFVDEKTRKKINILGGGYKKTLLENVDAENLPSFLGGECTCEDLGGCLYS
jgi:CRAL/TRIO domain